jgi:AcrR family transcriptional regulator
VPRQTDTKQRIRETARELFARRGVARTSLQEIADALGITKPALYYHFSSREDLVRGIVAPLIDGGEAFLLAHEALGSVEPRALLERYFDFRHEHRDELLLMLAETTTLTELGLIEVVHTWRERLVALLVGPDAPLDRAARAVVALAGIQDCVLQFPDLPAAELRTAAVDAGCAALGVA